MPRAKHIVNTWSGRGSRVADRKRQEFFASGETGRQPAKAPWKSSGVGIML